ncbi:MAG: biotin/lipoyl-binding protein, partial [Neofamilia sp.]
MEKFKLFFKNHYKKLIIGVALAAGIGFIGSQFLSKGQSKYPEITKSETTLLAKKDFVNSISESGKAKSETTRNVYAEKALPVKEIKVEVGDTVRTGDVIAILEDSTIQQQLEQKQAQIAATNRNAGSQIKSARDRLNEAIRNRDQGTNSQVVSAQNAVVSAYDAWQSAEKTFENLNNSVATGYNEVINSQMANEKNLENTQ